MNLQKHNFALQGQGVKLMSEEWKNKYGIYFKNWTDKDYVHNVSYLNNFTLGQYKAAYAFKIKNKNNLVNNHILQNNISINYKPLQYHLNTFKLNNYLIKICKSRNIKNLS